MARPRKIKQETGSLPEVRSKLIRYLPWVDEIIGATASGWRHILLLGTTRSGKSYQLVILLIIFCVWPERYLNERNLGILKSRPKGGLFVTVYRQQFVEIKNTLFHDFERVLRDMDLYPEVGNEGEYVKINNVLHNITFKHNGSVIQFESADKASKAKGLASDIYWLNEASEIREDVYKQLKLRLVMFAFYDTNPSMSRLHWVKRELLTGEGSWVYVHRSSWRENDFLDDEKRAEIMSFDPSVPENVRRGTADEYMWRVYGLGEFAVREGVVFPEESSEFPNGWAIGEFPEDCSWVWSLDVGFHDEMSFGRVGIRRGSLYIDELVYESGLALVTPAEAPSRDSLVRRFESLGVKKGDTIVYDAASAGTGDALSSCGYNAVPCRKYGSERSIVPQLRDMMRYKIFVSKRSVNWQAEVLEYAWKNKDFGDENPVSGSHKDHAIDMSRYGAVYLMIENGDYLHGLRGGRGGSGLRVSRGVGYRGYC